MTTSTCKGVQEILSSYMPKLKERGLDNEHTAILAIAAKKCVIGNTCSEEQ
jgi:hypothetical protein